MSDMNGPPPAASSWRLAFERTQKKKNSLLKSNLNVTNQKILSTRVCATTVHSDGPVAAIGGGYGNPHSQSPVVHLAALTAVNNNDGSEIEGEIGQINNVIELFSVRHGGFCLSLDWKHSLLLSAASNGTVYALPCNIGEADSESVLKPVASYVHEKAEKYSRLPPPPTPGTPPYTSFIHAVSIEPVQAQSFVSVENNRMNYWDVHRVDGPAQSDMFPSPILCCDWNGNNPNDLAFGGDSGSLKMVDMRSFGQGEKGVSWKRANAHDGSITGVKWNPFCGYWIMSTGSDSVVKVWDLRFGMQPVATLGGHPSSITGIDWCPAHAEVLLTAASDGHARIFNLDLDPTYPISVLETLDLFPECNQFEGGLKGGYFVRSDPSTIVTTSYDGTLAVAALGEKYWSGQVPYLPEDVRDSDLSEMQRNLYVRKFKQAADCTLSAVSRKIASSDSSTALALLQRVGPAFSVGHKDMDMPWRTSSTMSTQSPVGPFREAMRRAATIVGVDYPPNRAVTFASSEQACRAGDLYTILLALESLKMGDADSLLGVLDPLSKTLTRMTGSLKNHQVSDILNAVKPIDLLKCLNIGIRLLVADALEEEDRSRIIFLLLLPTVRDVEEKRWESEEEGRKRKESMAAINSFGEIPLLPSIQELDTPMVWRRLDSNACLQQAYNALHARLVRGREAVTELKLCRLVVDAANRKDHERVIEIMEDVDLSMCMSSIPVYAYFVSLLKAEKYAAFFVQSGHFLDTYREEGSNYSDYSQLTPVFARTVSDLREGDASVLFEHYLRQVRSVDFTSPSSVASGISFSTMENIILTSLTCPRPPHRISLVLPKLFMSFTTAMDKALLKLSGRNASVENKEAARALAENLSSCLDEAQLIAKDLDGEGGDPLGFQLREECAKAVAELERIVGLYK